MSEFMVGGMSCQHCVKAVTQAVQSRYPQARVDVDLATGKVAVQGASDAAEVVRLIEEEGYTAKAVDGRSA
jgi:copper chaperone